MKELENVFQPIMSKINQQGAQQNFGAQNDNIHSGNGMGNHKNTNSNVEDLD